MNHNHRTISITTPYEDMHVTFSESIGRIVGLGRMLRNARALKLLLSADDTLSMIFHKSKHTHTHI